MSRLILFLTSFVAAASVAMGEPREVNIKDYGALGDGMAADTTSINHAIEACSAQGGGIVRFPQGTYRSGTIVLKDNIILQFDLGATLLGSKDLAAYHTVIYPQGRNEALIVAERLRHIGIAGQGTIDGNSVFNPKGEEHMRGPHACVFYGCEDVSIQGVSVQNASNWAVMLWSCTRVKIDGISVRGGWDGVNMHDVKEAQITQSRFFTGDDCLAGSFWENVTIRGCVLNSSANAIRVAGRNVLFTDCLIYGPGEFAAGSSLRHRLEAGFQILPNRSNAVNRYASRAPADNMVLSNITMKNVGTPVWVDSGGDSAYNRDNLGIGRIVFQHIHVSDAGKTPFYVAASSANPAKEILLDDVSLTFVGGVDEAQTQDQGFSPFSVLQSYGCYFKNVARVSLKAVRMQIGKADQRPPIFIDHCASVALADVTADRGSNATPLLQGDEIDSLEVNGKAIVATAAQVVGLDIPSAEVLSGDPFLAAVEIQNPGAMSLASLNLTVGERRYSRLALMNDSQNASIPFLNLVAEQPGRLRLKAGAISRSVDVAPTPHFGPLTAPFKASDPTGKAEIGGAGERFYINDTRRDSPVVLQQGDHYAAAYLPKGLRTRATIIVKLVNPDQRTSWMGRVGIMVRNDMDAQGISAGYLALDSSPAAGSYLEWESDGKGRLNRHTEFEGTTVWPHYLKLERDGAHFHGWESVNGRNWRPIGEADLPDARSEMDVGMFAFRDSARFEGFRIEE